MSELQLCCECDSDAFPDGTGEGYVNLGEWRDRLFQRFTTTEDRLRAMIFGSDEPAVTITLNGQSVKSANVMEFQAGPSGWIVFFGCTRLLDDTCPRCGEPLLLLVTFGDVAFSATPELAVAS
jgi:hypothetical protein